MYIVAIRHCEVVLRLSARVSAQQQPKARHMRVDNTVPWACLKAACYSEATYVSRLVIESQAKANKYREF